MRGAPLEPAPAPLAHTHCPPCAPTCQVWNAVDNQNRKGHTSIIHGKYSHEETIATASFAGECAGLGRALCVFEGARPLCAGRCRQRVSVYRLGSGALVAARTCGTGAG